MDNLLHVLNCIEELLRELIIAEVRGATIELKGFDVIHSLVHTWCELVNTLIIIIIILFLRVTIFTLFFSRAL